MILTYNDFQLGIDLVIELTKVISPSFRLDLVLDLTTETKNLAKQQPSNFSY